MKIITKNRKASFNYEIINKYEAGLVLSGAEIKAIRLNNVSIQDSYISILDNEVYVVNMHINQYKFTTSYIVNPWRKRKLLLHKNEIHKIQQEKKVQHYVIIPTLLYLNNKGLAKLQIALCKTKKQYDKREEMKKRDLKRYIKNNSFSPFMHN